MTGGGFGGSVIALVPAAAAADVTTAVAARFARCGWRSPAITAAEPSPGACRLS
jgi:galactokinase